MVVGVPGRSYALDVLRERRATTPELRPTDADDIARGFVARQQPGLARAGVDARLVGLAELASVGGVQVVRFEMHADPPPGSASPALDSVEIIALADGFTYTLELRSLSGNTDYLRTVADAMLGTLRATPPQPSMAYRRGLAAMQIGSGLFIAAVLSALVFVALRRRSAVHPSFIER
jgi:hypothetical protein